MNNTPMKNKTSEKKKRKFNIIDFFIVIAILAIIFVVVYVISPWSQLNNIFNADERTIYYTIKLEDVDEEFNNLIRQGDEVIDSVSKNSLGRVEVIEESPKSTELGCVKVTDENGNDNYEGKWIESHDKYYITIRVKATSDYEGNVGYSVNGTRIAVGEKFYLRFPKFECTGYCTEISY